MIKIIDKSKCCGCEACVQVCPQKSIKFLQDHEGFFYPEVDVKTCIQCGLCEKACPVLLPYNEHKPLEVLAAINKDEKVRMDSSSGGVFTFIAEEIIRQGGVVFGVCFDDHWQAVFDCAETSEALEAFRGSKYIQARVGNSFAKCKQLLDQGRLVLFSGTQCQIAALLHFLRRPYTNLLTIDFVCHGVPSPKVWQRYLTEIVQEEVKAIRDVRFRDKRLGWKHFSFSLNFNKQDNTSLLSSVYLENEYMQAFLANLILRPSCYACPAKRGRSKSDFPYVLPAEFGWSDLGTWGSLHTLSEQDENHNAVIGNNVKLVESSGCMVRMPQGKQVVIQGLKDCIVAEHNNTLLICQLSEEQRIKEWHD